MWRKTAVLSVWTLFLLLWAGVANAGVTTVHVYCCSFSINPQGGAVVQATINAGDTIHWVWDDNFSHSTTSVSGSSESWDSGLHSKGTTGFSFDHTFNTPGTYNYFCSLHGFDNFDGTAGGMAGTITVKAAGTATSLAVANVSGVTKQTVQLQATLTAGGTAVNAKPIAFKVDNVTVTGSPATTNASGVATINYTIPEGAMGSHTISASFAGDSTYNASSGTGTLTVGKADTTITASNISGVPGQVVSLGMNLSRTLDGIGLASKSITIKVDGTEVAGSPVTTNSSGNASVNYAVAEGTVGSHTVTFSFAGDTDYNSNSGTATLTTNKGDTSIAVTNVSGAPGATVGLKATLTRNIDSAGVNGRTITFKLGGTTAGTAATNASGAATLNYTIPMGTAPGTQTITASFDGDASYNSSTNTGTLTVDNSATSLTVPNVAGSVGQTVSLSATLSSGGSGLSGKNVTIKVDGVEVSGSPATTDANGVATVSYALAEGTVGSHTIAASFAAAGGYQGSSGSGTLTVSAADTTLSAANVSGISGQAVTLSATLARTSDSAALSGKTVAFTVNGASAGTATTNASGVATKTYTIPSGTVPPASQPIVANFSGDANYNASTANATLAVIRKTTISVPNLSGAYAANVTLKGTLKSGTTGIATATLTFKIDGTTLGTSVTTSTGVATLVHKIAEVPGTHTITVEFAGDSSDAPSTGSGTLTVSKGTSVLAVANIAGKLGLTVQVKGTLKGGGVALGGRTISFQIDGTDIGSAVTDSTTGIAQIAHKVTESIGTHTISASFAGDSLFNASSGSGTLTAQQSTTKITPDNLTKTAGTTVAFGGKLVRTTDLLPLANKQLDFYQSDGTTFIASATTDSTGRATINQVAPAAGVTVKYVIKFAGDGDYLASMATGSLKGK